MSEESTTASTVVDVAQPPPAVLRRQPQSGFELKLVHSRGRLCHTSIAQNEPTAVRGCAHAAPSDMQNEPTAEVRSTTVAAMGWTGITLTSCAQNEPTDARSGARCVRAAAHDACAQRRTMRARSGARCVR